MNNLLKILYKHFENEDMREKYWAGYTKVLCHQTGYLSLQQQA